MPNSRAKVSRQTQVTESKICCSRRAFLAAATAANDVLRGRLLHVARLLAFRLAPWRNRRTGEAKLKLREMGSRYLFICLYVWLEKYFSRGDYRRSPSASAATGNRS